MVRRQQRQRRHHPAGYAHLYADPDRSRALPEFEGFGEFQSDRQLGFSFSKLVKGAIKYANPIGLSVVAAKAAAGLARKTSVGRTVLNAAAYLPGGSEFLSLVGGGGGGGGGRAAPARARARPAAKKIRLRARPARGAAPPPDEGPAPEDDEQIDDGGEEETGEGGEEETGDEGGEEGGDVEGLGSFLSVLKSVGKGFATVGKAVGKVGVAVGKTALETYIGRPIGGQSAAQQALVLARAQKAATPIWKNPLAIGGAAVVAIGGAVLLTRGRGGKRR